MLTWFHFKSDFIVTVAREPLCNDEKLKMNISKCQPWIVALHYVSRANHFVLGFIFFRNSNFVFIPQTQIVEAKYKPIPPGEYSDKLSETVTRSVMERVE